MTVSHQTKVGAEGSGCEVGDDGLCEESNLPVDFSVRLSEMSTKREGEGGNMRGCVRDRAAADVLLVPSRIGTVVPGSAGHASSRHAASNT